MADFGPGVFYTNRLIAGASTNATLVKNSPGQVGGYYFYNAAAYPVYIKLYNSATIPTAGSGTPVATLGVPAGAAGNVSFTGGLLFGSGIGFTITKLAADADTTVLIAGDLILNLFYA